VGNVFDEKCPFAAGPFGISRCMSGAEGHTMETRHSKDSVLNIKGKVVIGVRVKKSDVHTVVVPRGVEKIGLYAFVGCSVGRCEWCVCACARIRVCVRACVSVHMRFCVYVCRCVCVSLPLPCQ